MSGTGPCWTWRGERFVAAGAKVAAIWDRFGLSATAHYQLVNELVDTVEALENAPVTVYRLRRLREKAATYRRLGARRSPSEGAILPQRTNNHLCPVPPPDEHGEVEKPRPGHSGTVPFATRRQHYWDGPLLVSGTASFPHN